MTDSPLALHSEVVRPEWVDGNGHFNLAYYAVTFDHATDAFLDYLDLFHDYTADTLGDKVGKSRAYIYARLKLLALVPKARELFYEGKLTASTALASKVEWIVMVVSLTGSGRCAGSCQGRSTRGGSGCG